MMIIALGIASIVGASIGILLSRLGITGDKKLEDKYHGLLLLVFGAIAIALIVLVILDRSNLFNVLPQILPVYILLYFGAYIDDTIVLIGFSTLGLLLGLELSSHITRKKIYKLIWAIGGIGSALGVLIYNFSPVNSIPTKSKIVNGIVLQTINYTCAPASIATLARYTGTNPYITEQEVVKLAKTSRYGTNTLGEIRAMIKLGLKPEYKHNLTLEELLKTNKPALLHVREEDKGNYFSHAVALLSIDRAKKTVIIGNPLYGLQEKTFVEMGKYWFGEAIFVNLN